MPLKPHLILLFVLLLLKTHTRPKWCHKTYGEDVGGNDEGNIAMMEGSEITEGKMLVSPSVFLMVRGPRCRLFDSAVLTRRI